MSSPANDQPLSTRLKRCSKCERLRPLDRFYACPRSPDGLFNECKPCHNERRERNRRLRLLGGPLTFNSAGRLSGILYSAMELGVTSSKTLPMTIDMLLAFLAHVQWERADKAAKLAAWEEFPSLVRQFPYSERLKLLKVIAGTFPPKMRPKIVYAEAGQENNDPGPDASA